MKRNVLDSFNKKRILITGGLGFIGSNLAIALVNLGAKVTLVDSMLEGYGGNLFNIAPVKDKVIVNFSDIRNSNAMSYLVQQKDYIFHLAGQTCHIMSLSNPFPDIDINIKGTTILMEACRKCNPKAKVIYTGTRGQYGPSVKLPVSENTPANPKGIYEISNLTAERIIKVYNDIHGIKSVLLRLTNIYGPRAQMKHDRYCVVNWFTRLAIDNSIIKVFGKGQVLRDFLYVDDCVKAILMCAISKKAVGEIFNIGSDKHASILQLVKELIKVAGSGRWEFAPYTLERKTLEPGDFYSDITKVKETVGWHPKISLREGLTRTIAYYKKNKDKYW